MASLIALFFNLPGDRRGTVVMQLMPLMCLFMLLATHVKEQFVDSRARLMPGFRCVHVTLAAAWALLFAIVVPAAFALLLGLDPIGFVAISVLLLTAIVWIVLSMSPWIMWLAMIGWGLLMIGPGREWAWQLVSGGSEFEAVAVLAIGIVATFLAGMRLFRLNEDMPEYRWIRLNRISGKAEVIGPQSRRETIGRRLVHWMCDKHVASLTHHAHRASGWRWSEICRWQIGMLAGWPAFFVCFVPLSFFFLTMWIIKSDEPLIAPSAVLSLAVPSGAVVASLWQRRTNMLPRQSLMCVDRAAYLKQVGMGAASSQLQIWSGATVILAIWWQLGARQLFSATAACVLAFVALCQPFFFGVAVWLLRFRSPVPIVIGYLGPLYVAGFALILLEPTSHSTIGPIPLGVTAIFAVFGLILTWDAYRRWLVTDFD